MFLLTLCLITKNKRMQLWSLLPFFCVNLSIHSVWSYQESRENKLLNGHYLGQKMLVDILYTCVCFLYRSPVLAVCETSHLWRENVIATGHLPVSHVPWLSCASSLASDMDCESQAFYLKLFHLQMFLFPCSFELLCLNSYFCNSQVIREKWMIREQ